MNEKLKETLMEISYTLFILFIGIICGYALGVD